MRNSPFFSQAALMVSVLPVVFREKTFALKGGTAINLFIRDMPRLSVDVDLCFLPLQERNATIDVLNGAMERIKQDVKRSFPDTQIKCVYAGSPSVVTRMWVSDNRSQIAIEPNHVFRGTVFPVQTREMVLSAQELFQATAKGSVLSVPDVYGGKICATLDRQHPRDLFDVKILFENEGLTDDVRKSFLVYLVSQSRPIHELLNPTRIDLKEIFETSFARMTQHVVSLGQLEKTRETLIEKLQKDINDNEKRFLISFKEGKPEWDLLGVPGAETLPGPQWKLINIHKMDKTKHRKQLRDLSQTLGM